MLSSWQGQKPVHLWHLMPFYCRYQAGGHQSGNNICFKQKSELQQEMWGLGQCIDSGLNLVGAGSVSFN